MSSIREAVHAEMTNQGLGRHLAKADPVIATLEADRTANPTVVIADFVRANRYSRSVGPAKINAIAKAVAEAIEADPCDNATAAAVIRAFITSGSKHLTKVGRRGASEEEVTALLQIAGLEDVPVTQVTDQVDSGLLHRLIEFAKSKGFKG
jgi:formaldehyde-activating enzyme involved in methanogenesis